MAESWQWGWYQEEATAEEDWAKYRCAWLEGPLTIGVGAASLFVFPGAKWHWARAERPILDAAASLFDVAARVLRASSYVVTHDRDTLDYVVDGLTVEAVEERLKGRGYVQVATAADLWVPSLADDQYTHDVFCHVRG